MTLTVGDRLGSYEIIGALGAGGMGEVFRARDTKLNRDVAIKVLPAAFADDPDRLARFKREAQVLASLNHPNIAAIHGLEDTDPPAGSGQAAIVALVMELVEGEDLSTHIARGAIPIAEALPIARQIAEALEAAHEQGIVHRDLKPGNIKVRSDGTVKVLDFGLAKAMDPAGASNPNVSHSPTLTHQGTQAGMIMGTAAYMSPEQAKGKTVDKRADIWAFGVVLYEMLTGKRAFKGEDLSETLASVLKDTLSMDALPQGTPLRLRRLIERCLERDLKNRLRDIGEARVKIARMETSAPDPFAVSAAHASGNRNAGPWMLTSAALAGALLVGLLGVARGWGRTPADTSRVTRAFIETPTIPRDIAISPDGSRVVWRNAQGVMETRLLSEFESVPLKVSGLAGLTDIAFSPDGQSIAGMAGTRLKRFPISGGVPLDIATLKGDVIGCSWSVGYVYCGLDGQGVVRVPENGGPVEQVVKLKPGEYAATPRLLPDGDAVLFTLASGTQRAEWEHGRIAVQSMSSGRRDVIVTAGSDPRYLPTGHIAYVVDGIWFAVAIDAKNRSVLGSALPMIQGVARQTQRGLLRPGALIDVSATGTLIYVDGPAVSSNESEIVLADRSGKERVLPLSPKAYEAPRISPDGRQLAVGIVTPDEGSVWIYDLTEAFAIRRLTFSGRNRLPLWSPDGKRVAFQSDRGGDVAIYVQASDGSGVAQRLTTAQAGTTHTPESWSRDGRYLSYSVNGQDGSELWLRSMADGRVAHFGDVRSSAPLNSALSPDAKWIAYGLRGPINQAFVEPIPATGARYQISADGDTSHHPFWAPDGKALFYFAMGGGRLVSTSIAFNGGLVPGRPVPVAGTHRSNTTALGPLNYDITPDGRAFVFTRGASSDMEAGGPGERGSVKLVLNWFEELKAKVPVK
ncbi:MAG: protein kinase [Vicinamibacteria bacterium]